MRKDKKHCRKNSNDQSDSASTSDEESLSQRLHETSLFSQHNQHHHRHSRDEHRHAIRTADYASRYGEEPLNTEQPPYEDSDASMHASQTRYQPSQTYRATGQSRYDEEVSESRNNATFGSVMSEYEEGHSQEYGRSQQNFAPRQSYERPTYDEGNYAMLGAGMPQSEGPSEEYGQPQQNYASQRRYGPSQSYGETERPGYGKQMPDSRNNATFDSGMPQYEDRYQEYGQPQQNYALQYPSYETSVPPSRYQPPQQQMPQIAQYKQPPSRSSESADYSDRGQMPIESPGKAGSIPASDSSIIGPFVRFRTVDLEDGEHGTWIGSVLIVTNTSGILPSMELVAESGDDRPFRLPASKPVPLDAHQDQIFYRFEVRVPLFRDQEQTVAARIAFGGENPVEARFSIAGSTTPLRMAFYSCNGVSSDCTDEAIWKSPDSLWNDVLAKHEAKPFHFMIGGGDQIYCDPVWTDVPECKDWIEKSLPDRIQSSFPEQAKLNIENFYFENYRKLFNSGKYSQGLRAIPSIMVIDDHDIFDGVGTYPENLRSCPFMWGVARIGYRFFLLFQQHTTPEHSAEHGFFGAEGSHNFVAQLNRELAVVGADGRRERRLDQIMHPDSYEMMREELNRLAPSTLHLLAVLGVPILYPRLTLAENILQCVHGINSKLTAMSFLQKSGAFQAIMGPLGDQPELMDDLGDHWTAPPHETERLRFIEQMQNFARDRSVRVTFVSGDVHCCGVGRFKGTSEAALEDIKKDPNFMLQIISSGIQNVPPPAMVISALHQCSSKIKVNSSSEEEMVDLFGRDAVGNKSLSGNHKLLNRRNWTTIDQDGSGNVKFKIRVEAYSGSGIIGGAYGVVAPPLEI